jgi:hypothetical protein
MFGSSERGFHDRSTVGGMGQRIYYLDIVIVQHLSEIDIGACIWEVRGLPFMCFRLRSIAERHDSVAGMLVRSQVMGRDAAATYEPDPRPVPARVAWQVFQVRSRDLPRLWDCAQTICVVVELSHAYMRLALRIKRNG